MANWKYKLDLVDLWKQYREEKISIHELGVAVADRISKSPFFEKHVFDLENIVEELQNVEEVEHLDDAMDQLYDWADIDNICWVATQF